MSTVLYEKRDHIAYITLNRPEALNAVNGEMRRELEEAWHDFNSDHDSWVGILTGAGDRAFSSGADLRERGAAGAEADPRPVLSLGHGIDVYKPIVCGIHGYCLAAGLDMALGLRHQGGCRGCQPGHDHDSLGDHGGYRGHSATPDHRLD